MYGNGFYKNLSLDLKEALPECKGFSRQNLQYMKKMYLLYSKELTNCPQLVGNSEDKMCQQLAGTYQGIKDDIVFSVPWGHHCVLIDKYFDTGECDVALFYAHKVVDEGWSRNVLKSFIDTNLHLRQGKALTSFSRLLPAPESDLAQELTKDPYVFDFTQMTEPYKERELKKALMANISRFLLELGSGFSYVGEEYRLKVGQLGTYMTAVNHILKTEYDNPTIGLLICKDKDKVLAQYALESSTQPIGISEFQLTKFVPDEFKSSLPTIEDIETELK